MGTLTEIIYKNTMNTKIVGFEYSHKQRCVVFDIFGLINQPCLARDVHIEFFSNSICVYSL